MDFVIHGAKNSRKSEVMESLRNGARMAFHTVPAKVRHCMMNPITRLHRLDGLLPLTAGRQTMSAPRVTSGGDCIVLSIALCDQEHLKARSIRSFVVGNKLLRGRFYKDTPCTF